MRIIDWLIGRKSAQESSIVAQSFLTRDGVDRNLPLEHVQSLTGGDTEPYRKVAHMVQDHSYAAAEEFARVLEAKPTDELVHFFHDMFTVVCFIPRVRELSQDKDVGSAIIDGIHFEYYEDAAQDPVESLLHLGAVEPRCFFQTFVQAVGKTATTERFVSFAVYCVSPELRLGATDVLKFSVPYVRIVREKVASICNFTDMILEK